MLQLQKSWVGINIFNYCVLFWWPHYRKDVNRGGAENMDRNIAGLERLSCKGRLDAGIVSPGTKKKAEV